MSPIDVAVVRRKMQRILENLRELENIQSLGPEKYRRSRLEKKAAERWLQELIDAGIDINAHILANSGFAVPEEGYEVFIAVGRKGIIPPDLVEKLAPSAGLRSRLIHEYNQLDDTKIWESIATSQELFPLYLREIEEFLVRTSK